MHFARWKCYIWVTYKHMYTPEEETVLNAGLFLRWSWKPVQNCFSLVKGLIYGRLFFKTTLNIALFDFRILIFEAVGHSIKKGIEIPKKVLNKRIGALRRTSKKDRSPKLPETRSPDDLFFSACSSLQLGPCFFQGTFSEAFFITGQLSQQGCFLFRDPVWKPS